MKVSLALPRGGGDRGRLLHLVVEGREGVPTLPGSTRHDFTTSILSNYTFIHSFMNDSLEQSSLSGIGNETKFP